jgi:RNA recognition motif-containing protein
LFGSVGPLVKAEVNKDATGRSMGTATVIFANEPDAKTAIEEYNGAILVINSAIIYLFVILIYISMNNF